MKKPLRLAAEKVAPLRSVGVLATAAILLGGAVTSAFFYMRNQEATLGQMRELIVRDAVSMGTRVRANVEGYQRGMRAITEVMSRNPSLTADDLRKISQQTLPTGETRSALLVFESTGPDTAPSLALAVQGSAFRFGKEADWQETTVGRAVLGLVSEAVSGECLSRVVKLPVDNENQLPLLVVATKMEPAAGRKSGRTLLGLFSFEDLIEGGLDQSTTLSYDVVAFTETASNHQELLYFNPASYRDVKTITNFTEVQEATSQRYSLSAGDSKIFLVFTPTTEWMRRNNSPLPKVVFFLGLAMTGTLATLFVYKSRRASLVEDLVHERTAELALANMRLDESRGTFSSLLQACPDAINGKDNQGRWTFANRAFLDLAGINENFPYKGLKDDEVIARTKPANRKFLEMRAELDCQVLQDGQGLRHEMNIDGPDANRRYLDIHMLPVRGSDGGTVGLVAVYNDITELRRRINALQRSRERVKLLVENTATAIVEWDDSFRLIHWNPAAARLFGYDWEEVRDKPISFFADPESEENASQALDSFLREREKTIPQIFRHRNRRGNFLTCEWQNTPLIDEDGRPLGVTSFIYDVTERTKAEQALRKRDTILRGLAGSAAGFLNSDAWEPEAGELLRHLVDSLALSRVALVRTPPAENQISAYTVLEWVNPYWNGNGLMPADGVASASDPHVEPCRAGLHAHLVQQGEIFGPCAALPAPWGQMLAAQGSRSVLLLPLRIRGEVWGFLRFDDCRINREWSADEVDAMRVVGAVMAGAIARQILTKERLYMEKRLLLSQKRESLGMLAGGIARDFNNLVNHILGNASLGRTLAETDSTIDSCLASIEEHGLRAASLCRQMLAYAGHGEAQAGLASPNLIVLDVLNGIDPEHHRRIHIRKDLANGIPVVEVDVDQMRQAIQAVVQNAIEAIGSNHSGLIEVQTCPSTWGGTTADGAEICIRDTGCGMDLQVRDRVFDPFFSTKMTGRGLGLTIAQSIIEAHGGQIQIESSPGSGTTVKILLSNRRPKPEIENAPALPTATVSGSVLVVHGGRPIGHVTALAFQQLGFDTEECVGVEQAIKLLHAYPERYRLVAVEPAAPGAEAATLQRLRRAANSSSVILLTNNENCPASLKHFADEGLAVLLKGELSADSLRGAVATALGHS